MTDKFQCQFCNREFIREKSLINHMCEQKRRWTSKEDKYVVIGFNTWLKWYKLSNTKIKQNDKNHFEDFVKSRYYLAFVKFGKHAIQTKMLNVDHFLTFVIKNQIKLDNWCKDSVYDAYIRDIGKREDVGTVLERQIQIMTDWSAETGEEWTDFFENVHPNYALKLIRNGRISPWIILNSITIYKLFDRMNDEQKELINDFIDMKAWKVKMYKEEDDRKFVSKTLEDNGI